MTNLAKASVTARKFDLKKSVSVEAVGSVLDKKRDRDGDDPALDEKKKVKLTAICQPIADEDVTEASMAHALRGISVDEAMLHTADVLRYVAGLATKGAEDVEALKKERDDLAKEAAANADSLKVVSAQYMKLVADVKNLRANGALSSSYPTLVVERLFKTRSFEHMFLSICSKARSLGRSEGLKDQLLAHPDLDKHGFPSMEQLDAAIAEDTEALNREIRDGGFKFAILEHLKRLSFLPDMEHLKACDVDYNCDLPEEMKPVPIRTSSSE